MLNLKIIRQLCILIALIFTSHSSFANQGIIKHEVPFYATELPFYDLEGNKRYLEEFENSTLLLVFWATWCGTCVNEMHSLDTLARDFRKLPFKVLALSQDFQGIEAVQSFYKKHDIRYLEPFHDYQNTLFKDMHVAGMPCAFLVKPNNKIVATFKGEAKWHDDKIREMILAEIPGTPETPRNTYKEPSLGPQPSKKLENQEVTGNINAATPENQTNTNNNKHDESTKESKHNN